MVDTNPTIPHFQTKCQPRNIQPDISDSPLFIQPSLRLVQQKAEGITQPGEQGAQNSLRTLKND
jgi:hypothetical protein